MQRTRIKFCGITRVEDALAAAELGADAVGMVLHADSRRKISRQVARQILDALPPFMTPVGLFVDTPLNLLLEIIADLGLRHIQLHGTETTATVTTLSGRAVIKAIFVSPQTLAADLTRWRGVENLRAILLEPGGTGRSGGTGITNDWQAIRAAKDAGNFAGLPPVIAAGGLTPENVGDVVRLLRPWAVDVSSGIEESHGIKSRQKMTAFIQAVRAADVAG